MANNGQTIAALDDLKDFPFAAIHSLTDLVFPSYAVHCRYSGITMLEYVLLDCFVLWYIDIRYHQCTVRNLIRPDVYCIDYSKH